MLQLTILFKKHEILFIIAILIILLLILKFFEFLFSFLSKHYLKKGILSYLESILKVSKRPLYITLVVIVLWYALSFSFAKYSFWKVATKVTKSVVLIIWTITALRLTKGFSEKVEQEIKRFKLDPATLEIEITESQTRNPEEHIKICRQLQDKGIKIAIDDFGTGYSSLSVLKQLEINTLKVDREFIRDLPHEPAAALMVSTIVNMSLALGYNVVAEGVENHEQAIFLRELGCPIVQGYYFSKPVPVEKIPDMINTRFLLDVDVPLKTVQAKG